MAQTFQIEQSEAVFQAAVQDYATLQGWSWMHIQKAVNDRLRWRTPTTGKLGSGWPDLVLTRNGRLLFVELKAEKGKVTGIQTEVLETLGVIPCAEVHVWRPSDWPRILEVLSR